MRLPASARGIVAVMRTTPVSYRRAFTLVEVLVALVLLGAGILGLSASSTLVSRMIGDGSRLSLAATIATGRLEQLRAIGCASAASGTAVTRGIEERWSVAPVGSSLAALDVHITVTYPLRVRHAGTVSRTQRFRGALHCPHA